MVVIHTLWIHSLNNAQKVNKNKRFSPLSLSLVLSWSNEEVKIRARIKVTRTGKREREIGMQLDSFGNYQRPTKLLSFFFIIMTSPILVINYAQMSKNQMMECLIISFEYQSLIHNRKQVVTRLHSWDKWKLCCAHTDTFSKSLTRKSIQNKMKNIPIIVHYIFYTHIFISNRSLWYWSKVGNPSIGKKENPINMPAGSITFLLGQFFFV